MLKKLFIISVTLFTLSVIALAVITRVYGIGIKLSDGRYVGYSTAGEYWLFAKYRNFPVKQDGPYLFWKDGIPSAMYVEGDGMSTSQLVERSVTDEVLVIVDDQEQTKFTVALKDTHPRSELEYEQPNKLLVLSDFEGNFSAYSTLLKSSGVMDEEFTWRFGSGQLVIVGDMVDRGENVLPVLWLTYKLEQEAIAAGGKVHYILGNHERYLIDGRLKSAARKYEGTLRALDMSPSQLWDESTELGRWIRSKPVMIKIGDILYVHGGVSPAALDAKPSLVSIDKEAAEGFSLGNTIRRTESGSVIHGSEGLLFYRGFAKDSSESGLSPRADMAHVDAVLQHFDAKQIAIGHTLTDHIGFDYLSVNVEGAEPAKSGKILRIDVDHAGGVSEALLIQQGNYFRVDASGERSTLKALDNAVAQ